MYLRLPTGSPAFDLLDGEVAGTTRERSKERKKTDWCWGRREGMGNRLDCVCVFVGLFFSLCVCGLFCFFVFRFFFFFIFCSCL